MHEANKDKGRTCPILKVSTDELKMLLSAPEYYNWSQFRQNVLEKAINEITYRLMIWTYN